MVPKPYCKQTVDLIRVSALSHERHRGGVGDCSSISSTANCQNNDRGREVALTRRVEQQQQKTINCSSPSTKTQLETTIGYEHVAVDLTAWLAERAQHLVKQAGISPLLEDFDHLYRYANLLDLDSQIPDQQIVKSYVDITPRPPHHRGAPFPF